MRSENPFDPPAPPTKAPALPALHQGMLDEGALRALFDDLEAHADIVELRVKAGPSARASTAPSRLREVEAALRTREIHAVQLGYVWNGAAWRDTILAEPPGWRLVRREC